MNTQSLIDSFEYDGFFGESCYMKFDGSYCLYVYKNLKSFAKYCERFNRKPNEKDFEKIIKRIKSRI